ncbi:MAG: hypothetical protein P4M14_05065 [Gammaproteobacteria bacterium]|nr:hypothetical protein [Gammaproteobacteria bacterium]
MRTHARLVNPVVTEPGNQAEPGLLWKHLDAKIPSQWRLNTQWFFSFLPFVDPPAEYHFKMRAFINHEKKESKSFSIERLPTLLNIFNETPDFIADKEEILQQMSKKQVNSLADGTFRQLLHAYAEDKQNPFLRFVIPRFNFDRFKQFFRSIEAKLHLMIAKQQKEDPVRVKPAPLSRDLIIDIQWCGHLRESFSLDERKELTKLCHILFSNKSKPLVHDLLSMEEIFQHLQAIQVPDLFTDLWKEEIIVTTEQRFRFVFENKDVLKVLLKILTLEERNNLFRKLLANPNQDERFKIFNNFFQCIPRSDHITILNILINDARINQYYKSNLIMLFQGKAPALYISLFSLYVAQHSFGPFKHAISRENKLKEFDGVIQEISQADAYFSANEKVFCLDRLISDMQNDILAIIGLISGINPKAERLGEDTKATYQFINRFGQLINDRWLNRENTAAIELRNIINRLPTSAAFEKAFPNLKDYLEKLHQLYETKEHATDQHKSPEAAIQNILSTYLNKSTPDEFKTAARVRM